MSGVAAERPSWRPRRWRPLLIGVVVSAVCFVGYVEIAEDFAYSTAVISFDEQVSAAITSLRGPALTAIMRLITFTGGVAVVSLMTLGIVVWLWIRRRRCDSLVVAASVGVGVLMSTVFKGLFGRERPPAEQALIPLPTTASFPSGHAMGSLMLALSLGWVAWRSLSRATARWAAVLGLALWALLVGVSRIYLGVHWPSDVVASWLLGGAWFALVIGVTEAYLPCGVSERAADSR